MLSLVKTPLCFRKSFRTACFRKHVYKPCIQRTRRSVVPVTATFLSDIQLYDMSGMDIFLSSTMRNMITLHIPCMVIYRNLHFSWGQTAALTLFVSVLKTILQWAMWGSA